MEANIALVWKYSGSLWWWDRSGNDGYATIEIPQELLITEYNDPIHSIVSSTFPDLCHHHNDHEYFQSRAILASTNETVQKVNDYILTLMTTSTVDHLYRWFTVAHFFNPLDSS